MSNEGLYKKCKPYADRAFNAEKHEDLLCIAYIIGALEYADGICITMRDTAEQYPNLSATRSYFGASRLTNNTDAVIQAYVNKMKNEPERWDQTPNFALREVFTELAPCK